MDPLSELAIALDPATLFTLVGFADPLAWQSELLRSTSGNVLINAHRQSGKSVAASLLAIHTALSEPGSLSLIVSASQRQSNELFKKVQLYWKALGSPIPATEDSATSLMLETGSRIVSLPDSPDTVVGFSGPRLIIVDEASRVQDATYFAVRPMLTRSRGRLVCTSTPRGQRGFFYGAWVDEEAAWTRVEYKASQNPFVDPAFLEEEKRGLGPRWYAQEYECSFEENSDQFFPSDAILKMFVDVDQPPLLARDYLAS